MLSDLRESGSLEQDADMVILLHREDMYEKESPRAGEAVPMSRVVVLSGLGLWLGSTLLLSLTRWFARVPSPSAEQKATLKWLVRQRRTSHCIRKQQYRLAVPEQI